MTDKSNVEIACEIRRLTVKAVLIHDGAREAWIPLSQIHDQEPDGLKVGQHTELTIPEWLANEKGLI